jgi:hypothetical protein
MAAKKAAAGPKKPQPKPELVLEFELSKELTGAQTVKQIKSKLRDSFFGYGALDEIRVRQDEQKSSCSVFFKTVVNRGKAIKDGLAAGEDRSVRLFDSDVPVSMNIDAKGSGGGATTHTANKKKEKPEPAPGAGGRGGGGRAPRAGGGDRKCFECGEPGHLSRDCPTKGGDGGAGGDDRPRRQNAGPRRGGGSNVCFDFQKGQCDREDCRFSHDLNAEAPPPRRPRRENRGSNQPCFDFQKGQCDRGEDCRFSHDPKDAEQQRAPRRRNNNVCFDYQKGQCERGDECRFSHDLAAAENAPRRPRAKQNQCFDFQKGQCERGEGCRFSHVMAVEEPADAGVAEVADGVAAM